MVIHVVTMVPSRLPKTDRELSASRLVQDLREILKRHGGHPVVPILIGDATLFESAALDTLVGPFDVLVTRHKSIGSYRKAVASDEYQAATKTKRVLTFGFSNNGFYVEWVVPALKQVFGLMGEKVDTKSQIFVQAGGKVDYSLYQTNGDSGLENYKRRVGLYPNRAFYMIELCTKKDTPDGRGFDADHTKGWQQLLFSTGVQPLFGGKVVSLDKGPKMFQEIMIYKFPSRELFLDILECDHYGELGQLQEKFILDRFVELCLPIY